MKKLIIFGILVGSLFAQNTGQNVITQTFINNVALGPGFLASSNFQNIGQSSHMVRLQFSNVQSGAIFTGALQGNTSPNCNLNTSTNFYNIGPTITVNLNNAQSSTAYTLLGYGSYSCVRLNGSLTNGGATLTATYVGNSSPALNFIDQTSSISGMQYFSLASLTYGANTLVTPSNGPFGATYFTVYGMSIFGPATLTVFHLYCSPDMGTTSDLDIVYIANATNLSAIFPISIRSYGFCPSTSDAVFYRATGSGAAALNIQYRYE